MNATVYRGSLRAKSPDSGSALEATVELIRAYATLAKPRVVTLVLFTAVVACFLAAGGGPPGFTVLILLISGTLTAGGAAALNHYFDRDIDACMDRTRQRPLVNGRIRHPSLVLLGGTLMIAVGVSVAVAASLALALFELAGAFVYAVVYTLWLKQRTPLNIVIGGAAGSSAVLGGWAAVDPGLGIVPWLLASLVFLWTPAHFWSLALARRADYEQAGVPMLPILIGPRGAAGWVLIHILATVALSLWLGVAAQSGPVYFVSALVAAFGFVGAGVRLMRRPEPPAGLRVFRCSGVYLGLIFLSLFVETLVSAV